jgi:hypothetical protein
MGRIYSLSASCTWKDNASKSSTGKLYLVQKRKGVEKNRFDLFGQVGHEWSQVLARFDSYS